MCEQKPVVKTSYVDQEECETVTREECKTVTREQYSQVLDRVSHQSSKKVCRLKFRSLFDLQLLLCISGLKHSSCGRMYNIFIEDSGEVQRRRGVRVHGGARK